ncbi:hypothetical protein S1OALGB6SA_569 [Olavius algarvensis spirochete endosymbiont]|nr:hypothetical protein S1OALGB6SA_569 [Olavius algarvensis spirochete endosymbiont]
MPIVVMEEMLAENGKKYQILWHEISNSCKISG